MFEIIFILLIFLLIFVLFMAVITEEKKKWETPNYKFINTYKHLEDEYQIELVEQQNSIQINVSFLPSETKEPYYLIFDTETTGLLPNKDLTAKTIDKFPRIVEISWIILDNEFKLVNTETHLVKQNQSIPEESTDIHGITTEEANENGIELNELLRIFMQNASSCKYLVAHNMMYDINVLKAEYFRCDKMNDYAIIFNKKSICTMFSTMELLAIKKRDGSYKFPNLTELFKFCFFPDQKFFLPTNNHRAKVDVFWTAKSLQYLLKNNLITDFLN